MREVKFRVKIKGMSEVFDVTCIDFGNAVCAIVDPDRGNQKLFEWEQIEQFLQFTGLRDKNGKEIFEGDIVRWNPYYIGDYFQEEGHGPVVYDEGEFLVSGGGEIWDIVKNCQGTIIGNIHTTPELIP